MYGDLKMTFKQRALQQYLQRVKYAMQIDMQRRGVGVTNDAANSISGDADSDTASLIFRGYLRFVDMGVGRAHPLGGLAKTKLALISSRGGGEAFIKDKARTPKKVYSKNAYGNLSWLQGTLLYGYGEEAIAALKKELEGKK